MFTGIVRSLGGGRFVYLRALDSRGASRGVLVFWDNKILEVTKTRVGSFSVTCRFKIVRMVPFGVFQGSTVQC